MQERHVTVDGPDALAPVAVHGDRDPEPVRAGGHLPAARVAARPLPLQDPPRLRVGRDRAGDPAAPPPAASRRTCSATWQPLLDVAKLHERAGGSRRDAGARRRDRVHRRRRPSARARPTASSSARARAPRSTCWPPRRRTPAWRTVRASPARTSSTMAPHVLPHRLIVSGTQSEKVVSDAVEAALKLKRVDD